MENNETNTTKKKNADEEKRIQAQLNDLKNLYIDNSSHQAFATETPLHSKTKELSSEQG